MDENKLTPAQEQLLAYIKQLSDRNAAFVADELDREITALVRAGYLEQSGESSVKITEEGRAKLLHD